MTVHIQVARSDDNPDIVQDIEAKMPKPRGRSAAKPYMGSIGGGDA